MQYGYSLPFLLSKLIRIPNALMVPMNIMRQNTINESGQVVEKDRLTHDQLHRWGSNTSGNSHVAKTLLLPCMFGSCLQCLTNWAVAAQCNFPSNRIVVTKIDFKSAYCQCHLNHKVAIQTCTQFPEDSLVLMALCFMFGGAPGPYE